MTTITHSDSKASDPESTPRLVAVIDMGSTSLRMQIAEINPDSTVRKLESFAQAVSLGKDSFMKGYIEKRTIEDCVRVLEVYRRKLDEYGITDSKQIRVIATSGVREASNRLAFADRIFVATGFEIEPFEEAELHRVTYHGVVPFLRAEPDYFGGQSMVIEVGGGTSEILMLDKIDVAFSRTYRLGALRLRNTLNRFDAPLDQSHSMMEAHIIKTIQQIKNDCPDCHPEVFVAMGGDIRFAVKEINQQPVGDQLVNLKIEALDKFTTEILNQSPSSLATRFHMSLPDAQSLGPALLTQLTLAREFAIKQLLVANVSLRDGLLKEMALGKGWSDSIQEQIVRSAIQTGRKFNFDEAHAIHVSQLACSLFDQTRELHQLSGRYRKILQLAAILHDIGTFINTKSRHKHSMYLISHSEFFGIGSLDLELISQVARYHRGASPQPRHVGYARLDRLHRVATSKLAAILRAAKALDASLTQRIKSIDVEVDGNQLEMRVADVADVSIERLELVQAGGLFEDIFGKRIVLTIADQAG